MYGGTLGQVSNKVTWSDGFEVIDASTSDYFDLTGASITLKVERDGRVYLTGSTDNGAIVIPDLGQVDFRFEDSQMSALRGGTYTVGGTIARDGDSVQIFLGTVAILEAP